jgi:hypothetical protein
MHQIDQQRKTIRFITDEIYTVEVATVVAFDRNSSKATVQLCIQEEYEDGTIDDTPMILKNLPVRYPQMGDFVLYAPLEVGDGVYLHFSRTDWTNWLIAAKNNPVVRADGVDKHASRCAYVEVGARNLNNPARLDKFKNQAHIAQVSQYIALSDSKGLELCAGSTTVTLEPSGAIQIDASGNVNVIGDVIANGISLQNHQHDVPVTGGSSAGTYPSNPPTP